MKRQSIEEYVAEMLKRKEHSCNSLNAPIE